MGRDILFREDEFIFSYRIAGVLIRNGRILLQRPRGDDYAFIGGHVSAFESSQETLIREFREEIHADIEVGRLMAVGEIMFPWGQKPCHQIAMYYAVDLKDPSQIPAEGVFHGYDEMENERIGLDFVWLPLEELPKHTVYPVELIPHILSGAPGVFHFISRDL